MMKVKSNNVVRQLVEIKDVCNPNLLNNADFRNGVINQQMKTTYTGNSSKITYSIDQWFLSKSTSCALTVNDGYITVVLPPDNSFGCYVEGDLSGPLTISIKFKDEDVQSLSLNNYTKDEHGDLRYDFGKINNMEVHVIKYVQYGDTQFNFWIADQDAERVNTLNIEYIKLERGLIFTGMPIWNKEDELMKCWKYFYPLGSGWGNQYPARSDASVHRIVVRTPVPMMKTPSLVRIGTDTNLGLVTLNGTVNKTVSLDLTSSIIQYLTPFIVIDVPIGSSNQIGYGNAVFNASVALDARKY